MLKDLSNVMTVAACIIFFFPVLAISQQVGPKSSGSTCIVSSAHPLATQAGLDVLKNGGNAFDAAVAVATTLNVVEPMMSGMGGYGTILTYHAETKQVRYLDSSGKIPGQLDSDVFRAPTPNYKDNRRGPKSVSTPGNVNAWEALSKEYGKLNWKDLFAPAIKAATEGFTVTPRLEDMLAFSFKDFPEHAKTFYGKGDRPLKSGERLVQRDLANSLQLVAEHGSRVFYEGELAQKIHRELQTQGSFLSIDDLVADKAEWWSAIEIEYRGYRIHTASPPSTAFPSLIRLGMMSQFDNARLGHNSAEFLHRFAEVTKHAFWCRLKYAGDPEINAPPLEQLLSSDYWKSEVAKIGRSASPFEPPVIANTGDNTTHFVVADQWGNVVSATQTLGNAFGSRIMPQGTGIWFNNSLAYCTFEPKGNPMDAKPGQRKLSGDCPTIIFKDGQPWAALGTPGGHTIGQTVPQMVMNLIDFEMEIQQAIDAPRVSFVEPNQLVLEKGIDKQVIDELRRRGHEVRTVGGLGNAHGLRMDFDAASGVWSYQGAADPRGEGLARGN